MSAEGQEVEQARGGQSEGEGIPDADEAQVERDAEEVAQRQRDDEEGEEGVDHQRTDVGEAAEAVAEDDLHAVADLIQRSGNSDLRISRSASMSAGS